VNEDSTKAFVSADKQKRVSMVTEYYISGRAEKNAVTIFSSERMLHKDYYSKNSVKKKSLVVCLKGLDAKTK
jgi:hypothetical protein